MPVRIKIGAAIALSGLLLASAHAQNARKPTEQEIAAIRTCAVKYQDDVEEGERQCVFNLFAMPCTNTPEGMSNLGSAECFGVEWAIWDVLPNENFKNLLSEGDQQIAKLRAMQRAWIAYRDATCGFYMYKIQGSMVIPMSNARGARETARRALLLQFFSRM